MNEYSDEQIIKAVKVSTEYDTESPEYTYFVWKNDTNHKGWQCMDFIITILQDNGVPFHVDRFQSNETVLKIYDPEARMLFKMMFAAGDPPSRIGGWS